MGKPSQDYGVSTEYGVTQFYLQHDISEHTILTPSGLSQFSLLAVINTHTPHQHHPDFEHFITWTEEYRKLFSTSRFISQGHWPKARCY